MVVLEAKIERYLLDQVKKHNGHAFKWSSPANRGVPDRIVFINGQIWFIELKSETGKSSPMQVIVSGIIKLYTLNYLVISSKDNVDLFIKGVSNGN